MAAQQPISRLSVAALAVIEYAGLVVIALATVVAAAGDILHMLGAAKVTLADLLLLFIYLEVLVMVRLYFEIGQLPVRFPLYIAIVALARFLIIDMKELEVWQMLEITGAILVLAAAVLAIRYGQVRFRYTHSADGGSR